MHALLQPLLDAYQASLQSGGYPYIVLLMAMESSVIPIPSEVIIPPAVIMVMGGRGNMTVTGIVVAAVLGCWIGATAMYWASRVAGRPLVMRLAVYSKANLADRWWARGILHHFVITPEKVEGAERWSARFGSFGIFLSRMLPVVRHLIGIPAGVVRMDFVRYTLFTVLGSAVWCSLLAWVSHVAGNDERLMHGEVREITLWVTGAAVVLGSAYYFLVHRMSRPAPTSSASP